MIFKVEFNKGKHQRLNYYWVPQYAIWNGEYRQAFELEKSSGNVASTTAFKDYLVLTCKHPISYHNVKDVIVDKGKTDATFTEIKQEIERRFKECIKQH